jgi:NAD(P)H-hydrate epimerase
VVSIDIPSGLICEDNTYNISANILKADLTLTLQQKKLSMLMADNQKYLGRLKVLDIRLSPEYIQNTDCRYRILEENDIRGIMQPRDDFAHKGSMGHALLIAGSYGMAGASILATKACLRAGAGKVTVHSPKRNYDIMQISVPEAIQQMDPEETLFSHPVDTEPYNALGIGPGLGSNETTAIALIAQIRRSTCPLVIDADAINMLASNNELIKKVPPLSILTPHPKEFDRIAGESSTSYERLLKARAFAMEHSLCIVLKGAYTAVCSPEGNVYFNCTGNPGMATAGSGDVLTGIILSLLAQGISPVTAAVSGSILPNPCASVQGSTVI